MRGYGIERLLLNQLKLTVSNYACSSFADIPKPGTGLTHPVAFGLSQSSPRWWPRKPLSAKKRSVTLLQESDLR